MKFFKFFEPFLEPKKAKEEKVTKSQPKKKFGVEMKEIRRNLSFFSYFIIT
jgi:hypothetical protein